MSSTARSKALRPRTTPRRTGPSRTIAIPTQSWETSTCRSSPPHWVTRDNTCTPPNRTHPHDVPSSSWPAGPPPPASPHKATLRRIPRSTGPTGTETSEQNGWSNVRTEHDPGGDVRASHRRLPAPDHTPARPPVGKYGSMTGSTPTGSSTVEAKQIPERALLTPSTFTLGDALGKAGLPLADTMVIRHAYRD